MPTSSRCPDLLGTIMMEEGNYREAEAEGLAAMGAARQLPNPQFRNNFRSDALQLLAENYEKWNRPDKAAEYEALFSVHTTDHATNGPAVHRARIVTPIANGYHSRPTHVVAGRVHFRGTFQADSRRLAHARRHDRARCAAGAHCRSSDSVSIASGPASSCTMQKRTSCIRASRCCRRKSACPATLGSSARSSNNAVLQFPAVRRPGFNKKARSEKWICHPESSHGANG